MAISDKLTHLSETKDLIAQAIDDKGVPVDPTDTFRSYADKIGEISGGGGTIIQDSLVPVCVEWVDPATIKSQSVLTWVKIGSPYTMPQGFTAADCFLGQDKILSTDKSLDPSGIYVLYGGEQVPYSQLSSILSSVEKPLSIQPQYEYQQTYTMLTVNITNVLMVVALSNVSGKTIDWGDGSTSATINHTYTNPGQYYIKIPSPWLTGNYMINNNSTANPARGQLKQIFWGASSGIGAGNSAAMAYLCIDDIFWNPQTISAAQAYDMQRIKFIGRLPVDINLTTSTNLGLSGSDIRIAPVMDRPVKNSSIYNSTFNGCANLLQAPILPYNSAATAMTSTFNGCRSLVKSPPIQAGITGINNMFLNCYTLRTAPEIPSSVTTASSAFSGCYNLRKPPVLPQGILTTASMFANCTALTEAPALPASITNCSSMFSGCTGLFEAPTIPAGANQVQGMFQNCTSLSTVPPLNLTSISAINLDNIFNNCLTLRGDIVLNFPASAVSSSSSAFATVWRLSNIKVPSSEVANYQAKTGFTTLANIITTI